MKEREEVKITPHLYPPPRKLKNRGGVRWGQLYTPLVKPVEFYLTYGAHLLMVCLFSCICICMYYEMYVIILTVIVFSSVPRKCLGRETYQDPSQPAR